MGDMTAVFGRGVREEAQHMDDRKSGVAITSTVGNFGGGKEATITFDRDWPPKGPMEILQEQIRNLEERVRRLEGAILTPLTPK